MQPFWFFVARRKGISYGRPEGLPSVVPSRCLSAKELGVRGLAPENKKHKNIFCQLFPAATLCGLRQSFYPSGTLRRGAKPPLTKH